MDLDIRSQETAKQIILLAIEHLHTIRSIAAGESTFAALQLKLDIATLIQADVDNMSWLNN